MVSLASCVENYIDDNSLEIYPHYYEGDLGLSYSTELSVFKVWSPVSSAMKVKIYAHEQDGEPLQEHYMKREKDGTWSLSIHESLEGKFYTYQALIDKKYGKEVPDPYSYAVGGNGERSAIIDLAKTNPNDWNDYVKPAFISFNDIIIYKLQTEGLLDRGGDPRLDYAERGSMEAALENLVELGVTHVQIDPFVNKGSIHEDGSGKLCQKRSPKNFNVPEGFSSSAPPLPESCIKKLKSLIKMMHKKGLKVIIEVGYSYTTDVEETSFHQLMPHYYHRQMPNGSYSNASGFGNEVATERAMARQFIVESVVRWAREYHVDGFYFDLMGVIDMATMRQVRNVLDEIDPALFIYGEPYVRGRSSLAENKRATKANIRKLPGIAAIYDVMPDFEGIGFVDNQKNAVEALKAGIAGCIKHPQVDYRRVANASFPWVKQPAQCVNSVEANKSTLYSRHLEMNYQPAEDDTLNNRFLCAAIVLTSQGIPLLSAGDEFLLTVDKGISGFASETTHPEKEATNISRRLFNFYKGLIKLRKEHPAFRMGNSRLIIESLEFLNYEIDYLVVYELNGEAAGDEWKNILIAFNADKEVKEIQLPDGDWKAVLMGEDFYPVSSFSREKSGKFLVPPMSACILVK